MKKKKKPELTKKSSFNKKILIPIFLAAIMILSIIGFSISRTNDTEKYNYKGYLFVKTENGWVSYINNQQIRIIYGPKELEDITVPEELTLSSLNSAQKIYLTFNPEENLRQALYEYETNLRSQIPVIQSCTKDIQKCSNLPLKTCNDTKNNINVIQIEENNITNINYNNNCLLIQGSSDNLTRAMDKVILKLYGV